MGCLTKTIKESYNTIECSLFGCIPAGVLMLLLHSSVNITVTEEICRESRPLFDQWFAAQNHCPVVVESRAEAKSSGKVR